MKQIITLLATLTLAGCSTLTLDLPTKYGRISVGSDGERLDIGFTK